jgi:hypothetical protein
MKMLHVRTLAAIALTIATASLGYTGVALADDKASAVITSASSDAGLVNLTINGTGFNSVKSLKIYLSGVATSLPIVTHSDKILIALLPAGVKAGSYSIVLTGSKGKKDDGKDEEQDDEFFVTLGAAGATGPAGPAGPPGGIGPAGPAGATGPVGAAGASGPPGPVGGPGPAGANGTIGATGATGPIGATGPQGPQGATGPQGALGGAGPQGSQGVPGPQGPQGPEGATGDSVTIEEVPVGDPICANGGTKLTVGSVVTFTCNGLNGANGAAGATGATGPQGGPGPAGGAGPQGATGATGPQGPSGPAGPQGVTGSAGPQGPQGPQGVTGPQGATGTFTPQQCTWVTGAVVNGTNTQGAFNSSTASCPANAFLVSIVPTWQAWSFQAQCLPVSLRNGNSATTYWFSTPAGVGVGCQNSQFATMILCCG